MQVTIIGSGNIATVLGRVFVAAQHTVAQVYSRNEKHAVALAEELGASAISDLSLLDKTADLYLVAVTDDALPSVTAQLSLGDQLVIHTAGSVSKELLQKVSTRYGVLWPMKMIRKSMTTLEAVTIVVDGNSSEVTGSIEQLAHLFSPAVTRAGDAARLKMHMLATVVSNFPNHLFHLAADYCKQENIDFTLFHPIILETAQQVLSNHPGDVQAGPAFRGDGLTIRQHQALLAGDPQLRTVYDALTKSIRQYFGSGDIES
ncbi:MAG: hypothetical protein JWQ78_1765 [Sediminibacterium sp.]|nr:hypothetical protein [Sediminibacterium sp.]